MAQALSVHAHTKQNIHRDYASGIVSYPRIVAPLNRTRLDKAHIHRHVCKLVVYVYDMHGKENPTYSSLRLVIIDYHNKCGCIFYGINRIYHLP